MRNFNAHTALGATLIVGADDDGSRIGIKPRYRRWLNRTTSFEVSPGILLSRGNNQFDAEFPGFTGHAGLNVGDWFALTGQMEVIRLQTVGTDVAWYGGFKLGSYAAPIGSVVLLIVAAIAAASIETGF